MTIRENVSLKKLNTFGIEASTRFFAEAGSVEELKELISYGQQHKLPLFFLGGGSNILFTKDFQGLTIHIATKGKRLTHEDEFYYYVEAQAGEVWHEFVMYCLDNHFNGLENLSLIPGSVGASPMQNIGAYGVEVKDVFYKLDALNIHTLEIESFDNAACEFGYRESIFKHREKGNYVILSVVFKLPKKPTLNTSYGAITKELEAMGISEVTPRAISDAVIRIRRSKLPDPAVIGNAGSFFKNPEVSAEKHHELKEHFPEIVSYPLPNGHYKLAAGWLIESCGWKGQSYGDAGVHKLQALVLVNHGHAKGDEIYELSSKILASVSDKFGVMLEREVNIL